MKCPACGERLAGPAERCPACGAVLAPRVEGALAPAPRELTPPPRDRGESSRTEPLRDIPGLRKRERTWRDEVRERVRSRRQKRADAGLPLFEQAELSPGAAETRAEDEGEAAPAAVVPDPPRPAERERAVEERGVEAREGVDLVATPLSDEELADLPLHPSEPAVRRVVTADVPAAGLGETPALDEDLGPAEPEIEEEVSLRPLPPEAGPLERPARVSERAQAAAVDAGLLTVLAALVLYFTGRAARADLLALAACWPWLVSYLAFLGLFYAGYFTGTTGQTPGKMITGLRVVDPAGRPPGYGRAVVRAAAGALGTLAAGLGLVPMAFDPARRALHDRLLQTRVVHR